MKHHSGWRVRQVSGGVMEWTSPTGLVYTDEPVSQVFFREEPDDRAARERREREDAARRARDRERATDTDETLARALTRALAREEATVAQRERVFADRIARGEITPPREMAPVPA